MRLNLGCGDFHAPGWVNIDAYADDQRRPDIIADATQELPIPYGCAFRIYAGHILEHIPYEEVLRVLNLWHKYAVPGAPLMVVGPDCDRGRQMVARGLMTPEEFTSITIHHSDVPGRSHLWDCTETILLSFLEQSNWNNPRAIPITSVSYEWPLVSRADWQCAILSTA